MRCICVESELFMIPSRILSDFAYTNGLPPLGIAPLQLAASFMGTVLLQAGRPLS